MIPLHFPDLKYREEGLELFGTVDTHTLIAASAGGTLVAEYESKSPAYVVVMYEGDQRQDLYPAAAEVARSYIQALCRQGVSNKCCHKNYLEKVSFKLNHLSQH